MSSADANRPVQPSVADLMARYLQQRAEAQSAGLIAPDGTGEVVPFEAAPVQTVDPRTAWDEALAAVRLFQPEVNTKSLKAPPDWPTLVASQEPAAALAFAVGHFPQLVRHVQPLLHATKLAAMRPNAGRPIPVAELEGWARQQSAFPQVLLALGSLRLARQFDAAEEVLTNQRKQVPAEWQAAFDNEAAALAWQAGKADQAVKLWKTQPASVPVLFNRGMAALFTDKATEARKSLSETIRQLPEASAWHHLGQLYLAMAEMRR